MRPWISQTRAGRRPAARLACCCLVPCCLVVLAGGCRGRREAEHVEVSGRVLLKGEPLPGGRVTFVTDDGFASNGVIDEQGKYTIKAPTGNVRISVDNRMLNPANRGAGMEAAKKGAGRPEAPPPDPVKGTYKPIAAKNYVPDQSGLTYEVTKEPKQTFDIKLTE
jgi:hypothetical protein